MSRAKHPKRFIRWTLAGVATLVVAAVLVTAGAWWWAGSDTSLASAIRWAQRWLPEGDTLQAQDVSGSLRRGGHIGVLRWQRGALSVEARDVVVEWATARIRFDNIQLDTLRAAELVIDDQREPSQTPVEPLQNLSLPVRVDTPLAITRLKYSSKSISEPLEASDLSAHYSFNLDEHALQLRSLVFAAGRYEGQATLGAANGMPLKAQLSGAVLAPVPGGGKPIEINATAQANGTLGGADAALDVSAQLLPRRGNGMRAEAAALIHPWQAQPIEKASAEWKELDLSVLWPQAPRTRLAGTASVAPTQVAGQWQINGSTANAASGPLDRNLLPFDSLKLAGTASAAVVDIASLQASMAGGTLSAQGRWTRETTPDSPVRGWLGTASFNHINPAAVHSQMAQGALDGQAKATADGSGSSTQPAIAFEARVTPSAQQPRGSQLAGLKLRSANAQGRWDGAVLALQALKVETGDALLQAKGQVRPATRATQGEAHLTLPGAQLDVQGSLSATDGQGTASVAVSDAARANAWLAALPVIGSNFTRMQVAGAATLNASWKGGWQRNGDALAINARAQVPRFEWRATNSPATSATRLRDVRIDAEGSLAALKVDLAGGVESGTLRAQLQARAEGGRAGGKEGDGHWTARVLSAAVNLNDTSALRVQGSGAAATWRVALKAPVGIDWRARSLVVDAGSVSIQAPAEGTASLDWQPVRWSHNGARASFSSKGELRGVPQQWLELLGQTQLAALGLEGNLLFDGEWDIDSAEQLRLHAAVARRSGDVQLLTGTAQSPGETPQRIAAGVKEARLSVDSEGDNLRARLRWDSANAGQASADLTTRISRSDSGISWPDDAPVSGTVEARLPQVGIWSVLAPPGWRLRGTMDARATLSGIRSVPQWQGTLAANELSLRSVVDGIEFSNGQLRATLDGQRLNIDNFTLRGAPMASPLSTTANRASRTGDNAGAVAVANATSPTGPNGGTLLAKGYVQWNPAGSPAGSPAGNPAGNGPASEASMSIASRLQMSLQATASALRVSSRADRRLVISGDLQADLAKARLKVIGNLKADQALFILPDENTPSLSDDVIVRRGTAGAAKPTVTRASAVPAEPQQKQGVPVLPELDIALDLGRDFRLQGRGLVARLTGTLNLSSTPVNNQPGPPRLTGDVRIINGTYKAYGQNLDIEEGLLRFTGPYDNPTLAILAIRPNLSQRVGVQINGTALLPRVRLYAEPDLPDAEKLAWLVLGRAAANGGAEAAVLQQAALALLGGNGKGLSGGLAESLGLDELSFRGSASNTDGTTTSAAVTFGKRLSRNFYVAYERSVAGTLGTFYIFYDLSRRFTLRAQTGEQSAVDLIFTFTYD